MQTREEFLEQVRRETAGARVMLVIAAWPDTDENGKPPEKGTQMFSLVEDLRDAAYLLKTGDTIFANALLNYGNQDDDGIPDQT